MQQEIANRAEEMKIQEYRKHHIEHDALHKLQRQPLPEYLFLSLAKYERKYHSSSYPVLTKGPGEWW